MNNTYLSGLAVALIALLSFGSQQIDAQDEKEQIRSFSKAYRSAFPAERKSALEKLRGLKSKEALSIAHQVTLVDKDVGVRKTAFGIVCDYPDTTGAAAQAAAKAFNIEKDRDAKVAYASMMSRMEFKTPCLNVLTEFIQRLQYLHSWDRRRRDRDNDNGIGGNNDGGSGSSGGVGVMNGINPRVAKKMRAQYETVLRAINSLSGENFPPSRATNKRIKKWWPTAKPQYYANDVKLVREKRGEDVAAAKPKQNKKAPKVQGNKKLRDLLDVDQQD